MNTPEIQIASVGNVWTRMMHFKNIGDIEQGHSHQFHHATLLASGSVRIRANGKETDFTAPHLIWIHKDTDHELEALAPDTVCACIHGVRGNNNDLIDPGMIPSGVIYEAS